MTQEEAMIHAFEALHQWVKDTQNESLKQDALSAMAFCGPKLTSETGDVNRMLTGIEVPRSHAELEAEQVEIAGERVRLLAQFSVSSPCSGCGDASKPNVMAESSQDCYCERCWEEILGAAPQKLRQLAE